MLKNIERFFSPFENLWYISFQGIGSTDQCTSNSANSFLHQIRGWDGPWPQTPTVIFWFHWSPCSLAEVRSKNLVIREDLMQRAVLLAERFCLCRGCNEWKVRRRFTRGCKEGYHTPIPIFAFQTMAVLQYRCWHFPLDCWCRDPYRTLRSWAKQPGNRTPENAEQEQKWIDARGELGSFWALGYRWVNYGEFLDGLFMNIISWSITRFFVKFYWIMGY